MKESEQVQSGLDKYNRIKPMTNIIFNFIFILLGLITLFPVLFVVIISLSAESSIQQQGYQLIPTAISLDGYKFLYQQSDMILRALGISLFATVVGTILGVILTTSMGYVMSRPQYRLKKFVTWLVFIPMIFNGGLVSSYFITANLLNLKDSVWALILPLAVSSFNVIICKTFFRSTIPDALVESAKIDGATQFRIFFRIVLPISLPVLATIGLFLCFSYWNDWFQSMLYIDNQNMYSLQALLNKIMGQADYLSQNASSLGISVAELAAKMPKESARMAIAVLIVLPIACAYPFFQKYFTSGLTIGAVKE